MSKSIYPTRVGGLVDVVNSPAYATGVGLVMYGAKKGGFEDLSVPRERLFARVRARMAEWFSVHLKDKESSLEIKTSSRNSKKGWDT